MLCSVSYSSYKGKIMKFVKTKEHELKENYLELHYDTIDRDKHL